jgi:peptide chain release factor subunit 3
VVCELSAWFYLADAGKSTIGGQILYLTGSVDERTIQKYEREAKDKNRDSW